MGEKGRESATARCSSNPPRYLPAYLSATSYRASLSHSARREGRYSSIMPNVVGPTVVYYYIVSAMIGTQHHIIQIKNKL